MLAKGKRLSNNSRSKSKGSRQHARKQSAEHNCRTKDSTSVELKGKVRTENSVHRKTPINLQEVREHAHKHKLRLVTGTETNVHKRSETNSDRHRKSLSKANRTEEAFEEDPQSRLDELKKVLSNIGKPTPEVQQLRSYFRQIQRALKLSSEPLASLLQFLHTMYTAPLERLFEIVLPFEALLIRREQLSREVEEQIRENERLKVSACEPEHNEEVLRLKEHIERQQRIIEEKRDVFERFEKWNVAKKQPKDMPKLEIEGLHGKVQSYYEEFTKHLQEEKCSESWRLQFEKEQHRFDPV